MQGVRAYDHLATQWKRGPQLIEIAGIEKSLSRLSAFVGFRRLAIQMVQEWKEAS